MHHHPYFRQEHPIAFAHRGGRALWPENTLYAFQQAYDLGYRFFETDLHLTADGVLVLFHDDTLERTTDGTGPVSDRTLDELRRLDAGYHLHPDDGYPFRGQGIDIPTLDEAFDAFPDAWWTLELKQAGLAEPLAELLRRRDMEDRVIVGSFRDAYTRAFREAAGGRVLTSTGMRDTFRFWAASRLGRTARVAADALQVPPSYQGLTVVDRRFVDAAHRAGKAVHVWTVDEPDEIERLLDLGVDGVMSDRPDVLRDVLLARGEGGPWHPLR